MNIETERIDISSGILDTGYVDFKDVVNSFEGWFQVTGIADTNGSGVIPTATVEFIVSNRDDDLGLSVGTLDISPTTQVDKVDVNKNIKKYKFKITTSSADGFVEFDGRFKGGI